MATLLSSEVQIREVEPNIRIIEGVETSRPAFVGVTERGPVNEATLIDSFESFLRVFGGFTTDSQMAEAVQGFFAEGGRFCYVVRVVHYTDVTDPTTQTAVAATLNLQTPATSATRATITGTNAETFDLTAGDQVSIDVDGGGAVLATFDAAAGTVTSGNTETFSLVDGDDLDVEIDGGASQNIVFLAAEFADIANATAVEVASVINAKITGAFAQDVAGAVVITSDVEGTDSSVQVTGGLANAAGKLNFPTSLNSGTGDVANIDAVTGAEIKTVVEADVAGTEVTVLGNGTVQLQSTTTGPTSSLQVASGAVQIALGWTTATVTGSSGAAVNTLQVDGKTPGTYANTLTIQIAAASNGDAERFNLTVIDDGVTVGGESYPNLTMDDLDDRFVETIINADPLAGGSRLINVTDLDATTASQRPADGTFGPLTGGDDGLTGLVDQDFLGGSGVGKTSLRALDELEDVAILAIPGQATSVIHNGMITYAEVTRSGTMIAVLDPPAGQTAAQVRTYALTTAGIVNLTSYAALYWPRIKITNPDTTVFGQVDDIVVPPSGHVAGVYARTDSSRPGGIFLPPAGVEVGRLLSAVGLETTQVQDKSARDLIFPDRINPIRIPTGNNQPPRPYLDGARTLARSGNFPYVHQRRGAIFIEVSLQQGLDVERHKPNTRALRQRIARLIEAFLLVQLRVDAFATRIPEQAFFVDVSDALNPPSAGNVVTARVGLAFADPAEFIVILVSADRRALEEELGLAA